MYSNRNLSRVDLQVYWRDKQGFLHPHAAVSGLLRLGEAPVPTQGLLPGHGHVIRKQEILQTAVLLMVIHH
jgi:hypothetical protein